MRGTAAAYNQDRVLQMCKTAGNPALKEVHYTLAAGSTCSAKCFCKIKIERVLKDVREQSKDARCSDR